MRGSIYIITWLFSFLGNKLEKQRLEWDIKEAKRKQAAAIGGPFDQVCLCRGGYHPPAVFQERGRSRSRSCHNIGARPPITAGQPAYAKDLSSAVVSRRFPWKPAAPSPPGYPLWSRNF